MPSAFDTVAQGISPDDLTQGQGKTTPKYVQDYLGRSAPLSFDSQPALPTGVAAPVAAQAPSGPSGTGAVGEKPATGLLAPPGGAGGQVLTDQTALGGALQGGSGSEGAAAPGVGQNTDVAGGAQGNIGLTFGAGPAQLSVGPTGTIGVGLRGGGELNSALSAALSFAGIPTSINVPSLIASLTASPALGIAAGLAGAAGFPLAITGLAHFLASMSPESVTTLQAMLADPNPETQLTLAQAIQVAAGGALGPSVGGPQPPSPTRGYAIDPNTIPTNREDVGPTTDPNATAPANEATATATTGTGVSSSTGSEGAPAGPSDGAPGGSGDSPAM